MYNELGPRGFTVVGITQFYGYYKDQRDLTPDQEFAKLPEFVKEFNLPWPLIVGGKENFQAYGVNGIPQYVVIDRQGKVASITIGYSPQLHEQVRKAVEKALAESASR